MMLQYYLNLTDSIFPLFAFTITLSKFMSLTSGVIITDENGPIFPIFWIRPFSPNCTVTSFNVSKLLFDNFMLMVCIAPAPSLLCTISVFNPYLGMNTDKNTIATITKPTFIASLATLIRVHFPGILLTDLSLLARRNRLNRSSSSHLPNDYIFPHHMLYLRLIINNF